MHYLSFLHNLSSKFCPVGKARICMRHPVIPKQTSEMHVCIVRVRLQVSEFVRRIWLNLLFSFVTRILWRLKHLSKQFLPLLLLDFSPCIFTYAVCRKPGFPGNLSFQGVPRKKDLRLNWFVANQGPTTPINSHDHNWSTFCHDGSKFIKI